MVRRYLLSSQEPGAYQGNGGTDIIPMNPPVDPDETPPDPDETLSEGQESGDRTDLDRSAISSMTASSLFANLFTNGGDAFGLSGSPPEGGSQDRAEGMKVDLISRSLRRRTEWNSHNLANA